MGGAIPWPVVLDCIGKLAEQGPGDAAFFHGSFFKFLLEVYPTVSQ